MKIFYSELVANPAYYSFGYSVYGVPEDTDTIDECYEQGFLPFVGARDQDPYLMYMARGTRVKLGEFTQKHYHARVKRKVEEAFPKGIEVREHRLAEFPDTEGLIQFFLTYFTFRFGKEAMSKERMQALIDSPYLTHVIEYRYEGTAIAYSLEVHAETFVHVWHQAYAKSSLHTHLGIYLYIELMERAQAVKKAFLYFGVTYGNWMVYKTNFQPLQFWNGATWVDDKGSKKLKELFAGDPSRLVAFVDEWRAERSPYYPAPTAFRSGIDELKYLMVLMTLFPRLMGIVALLFMLILGYAWVVLFML